MKKSVDLLAIIQLTGTVPNPVPEFRFAPPRRWRLDYAWPDHKIAVEVEGGIWSGGRHIRPKGFLADLEKYNELAILGWRLIRVTPQQIRSGEALRIIERCFHG